MERIDCGYRNTSDRMVILRCCGPEQFFLERVVFPFELLSFQCPADSEVNIWTHGLGGADLLESLPASALRISETVADTLVSAPAGAPSLAHGHPGGAERPEASWLQAG